MTTPPQYRNHVVAGMSCDHCALTVREEIEQLPGVTAVEVDLASGRLGVAGAGFSADDIRRAVADAGYEVVS